MLIIGTSECGSVMLSANLRGVWARMGVITYIA